MYTPFWMKAPPTTTRSLSSSSSSYWDAVDQQILDDAGIKMKELRSKFCSSAKKNKLSWSDDDNDKGFDDDNYAP
jgi:hypothetical protein